ncbi:hypothetical protein RB653_008037 [Dictyostelium firmibasis]|uniref:Uncharacterized protein n=1 Tax=Dictyostelium firmibasis TaxID=79012 RepID=A0AAN7TY89_9MYCE
MDIKQQQLKETDIAVIGLGFRFPGENNEPVGFWKNLKSGFDSVDEFQNERWSKNYSILGQVSSNRASLLKFDDWKNFDPLFFGINPTEAAQMDPQQRLSLLSTWEALEDAHLDPIELRGSNTSVFLGSYTLDFKAGLEDRTTTKVPTLYSSLTSLSNRVSYCFDFRGQSVSMDTACSSSSNAVISGCNTLINGSSSLSVCGGANFIIDPCFSKSVNLLGMDTKSGKSMSFDESADGFCRGEGCGIVILKRLSDAIKDGDKIYCTIKGFSSNIDGKLYKQSFLAPSVNSQSLNIDWAFESTRGTVNPDDIFYVEAHGTGTPVGDPIELEAISTSLKTSTSPTRSSTSPLLIGSLKSNMGHTESASGVASLIKCCLMFKHRKLTPNINFNNPNPRINFKDWNLKVVTEIIPFPKDKQVSMIINNFGATGSNCCFILSEYIENTTTTSNKSFIDSDKEFLIPFSTNSKKSFDQYKSLIVDNYSGSMAFDEFVSKQIFTKTKQLSQRSVIVSKSDWKGFNEKGQQFSTKSNKLSNISLKSNEPTIVFIMSGQGPQFNKMGIELYEKEPMFRDSMDEIDELFKKFFGYSVLGKIRNIADEDKYSINLPTVAQPTIAMIQISLVRLFKHWGINPSFFIGHCLGENTASYCSGLVDLETCVRLIYLRSTFTEKLNGSGKMLAVTLSKDEYIKEYSNQYPSVEIGCDNSSNSIVLSGPTNDLTKLSNSLKSKSIFNVFLGSNIAIHSKCMDAIKEELIPEIGNINSKPPTIPIFSTVTSELFFNGKEFNTTFNAEYIHNNIRKPVLFRQTITNLYNHIEKNNIGNGSVTFIEISPHPVLSFYLNEMKPKDSQYFDSDSITTLTTLNRKKTDVKEIQKLIATLYCQGYDVDFESQFPNSKPTHINKKSSKDLPRYQWDFNSYWYECEESYQKRTDGPPITILGNSNKSSSPFTSRTTYIDISKEPFQWLKGHVVEDKYYFPGFGYIDNILNIYPNQDLTIHHLEFNEPFILYEGKNLEMTTNIINLQPKQNIVCFHTKDQNSNEWIQTSKGTITVDNNSKSEISSFEKSNFDIESLKKQHNFSHLYKSDFYEHIRRITSITYKDCFQRVEECWIGKNHSTLVKVSTKKLLSKYDDKVFLNGSILDSCVHGALLSIVNNPCSIVFDSIDDLKFYFSNMPPVSSKFIEGEEQFIYVLAKKSENENSKNSFSGSFVAFLESGDIIFEAKNVVCTAISTVTDSCLTEYPNKELFSFYLESKDSEIENIKSFDNLFEMNKYQPDESIDFSIYNEIVSTLLFNSISSRSKTITKESLLNDSIDQLMNIHLNDSNLKHSRLLKFVFETLKSNNINCHQENNNIDQNDTVFLILSKSIRIISTLLFPLKDDIIDQPQTLLDNGLLDNFYSKAFNFEKTNSLICDIISKAIEPLRQERTVFRILQLGGGVCSLSEKVIESIDQLLKEKQNSMILIEYTFADVSPSYIHKINNKLNDLIDGINNGYISILYKTFDLDSLYSTQSYNPSYYDIVTFTNVLHFCKNINFGLEQMYNVLKPNGHLLFVELPNSLIVNTIFGCFEEWWSLIDNSKDSCIDLQGCFKLLSTFSFSSVSSSNLIENSTLPFVVHAQKQSLLNLPQPPIQSGYNVFLYTSGKQSPSIDNFKDTISKQIFNHNCKISTISSINEYLELNIENNDKSIILFLTTIDKLEIDNFNEVSFELFFIARHLFEKNYLKTKLAVISANSQMESTNYFNSSVLGSMKYFEDNQISIFSFDYDSESISNESTLISSINLLLLNSDQHPQIEYVIRGSKVFFERIYKESIYRNFGNRFSDNMISKNKSMIIPDKNSKIKSLGKTVLVTGQTGIILEILKWIIKNSTSVENIIILSFSKMKWELKLLINQTLEKSNKIKFYFKDVDVGNEILLNKAIDEIYENNTQLGSVDSIIHFAFNFVKRKLSDVDLENFQISSSAKVNGTIYLHNISLKRGWELRNFVLSSSIASVVCHTGAPSYVAANNVLDSFSRYRRSIGLPCTTINMGPITSTGTLTLANNKMVTNFLEFNGFLEVKTNLIFGTIDLLSGSNEYYNEINDNFKSLSHNSFLCGLDWNLAASYLKSIKFCYKMDYYTNSITENSKKELSDETPAGINKFLSKTLAEILSIEESLINENITLVDYGADSLHSTLFKNAIEKQFFSGILTISQIQTLPVKTIIQIVNKTVSERNS